MGQHTDWNQPPPETRDACECDKLLLVDGYGVLWRAHEAVDAYFYAGRNIGPVVAFVHFLLKELEAENPGRVAVAFGALPPAPSYVVVGDDDEDEEVEEDDGYYDEDGWSFHGFMKSEPPLYPEALDGMGIFHIDREDLDTADILATAAKRAQENGLETLILTDDRRLLAAANERVTILLMEDGSGGTEVRRLTRAQAEAECAEDRERAAEAERLKDRERAAESECETEDRPDPRTDADIVFDREAMRLKAVPGAQTDGEAHSRTDGEAHSRAVRAALTPAVRGMFRRLRLSELVECFPHTEEDAPKPAEPCLPGGIREVVFDFPTPYSRQETGKVKQTPDGRPVADRAQVIEFGRLFYRMADLPDAFTDVVEVSRVPDPEAYNHAMHEMYIDPHHDRYGHFDINMEYTEHRAIDPMEPEFDRDAEPYPREMRGDRRYTVGWASVTGEETPEKSPDGENAAGYAFWVAGRRRAFFLPMVDFSNAFDNYAVSYDNGILSTSFSLRQSGLDGPASDGLYGFGNVDGSYRTVRAAAFVEWLKACKNVRLVCFDGEKTPAPKQDAFFSRDPFVTIRERWNELAAYAVTLAVLAVRGPRGDV